MLDHSVDFFDAYAINFPKCHCVLILLRPDRDGIFTVKCRCEHNRFSYRIIPLACSRDWAVTMKSAAVVQVNKAWLLEVDNLARVRECRRRISDEFGVKLQLSADDLLDRIQGYADRSHDTVLQRLARPIAKMLAASDLQLPKVLDLSNIPVVAPTKVASGWSRHAD
jgi:hypothetical protein